MKFLNKFYITLSFLFFAFSDGTQMECLFDNVTQNTITLDDSFLLKDSSITLVAENKGNQPILECFPFINSPSVKTVKQLRSEMKKEEYPLLYLYKIWKHFVIQSDFHSNAECHPLDLLNFKSPCSQDDFETQFLRLCQELGCKIKLANVHGKNLYDLSFRKGEWNLFDLKTGQFYLDLNNTTIVDSETLMDDPFQVLRTKHNNREEEMDFKNGWNFLSHFEILEPASAPMISFLINAKEERPAGYDLYPGDRLILNATRVSENQMSVTHQLNLSKEFKRSLCEYASPIPINKIENKSSCSIFLPNQGITLKPNESLTLDQKEIFYLTIIPYGKISGIINISGTCACNFSTALKKGGNQLHLGSKVNSSLISLKFKTEDEENSKCLTPAPKVLNSNSIFDYCSPLFIIDGEETTAAPEKINWQISADKEFNLIPSNLDRIELYTRHVALNPIDETFLNAGDEYFFRVKCERGGQWSEWSDAYRFIVEKPLSIEETEFDQIDKNTYEINWERFAPEPKGTIEYLVFGSNAIDFIPSVYCDQQINAIIDGEVVEKETNDTLVAITKEPKIQIKKNEARAYYRIIAREKGQLSVPSSIIHLYDCDLTLPRSVLQSSHAEKNKVFAKRTLFPVSESSFDTFLPHTSPLSFNEICKPTILLRMAADARSLNVTNKECPSYVAAEAWEAVRPWLMPDNHPCKAKLDRMAREERFILNPKVMKRCGFPKAERVGRWSRVCASTHRDMQDYYFKIYHDCEVYIKYDWKRWIHRCEGAQLIRECIKKNNLQSRFRVPRKWIYCWPADGKMLPENTKYVPKNFILVCDNMHVKAHNENEKLYKKRVDEKWMQGIYTIFQECGLYDSVYCFNIPFNKDGCICIIDTEYWHKWPVPFERLTKSFSKKLRPYWQKLTRSGKIPDGINSPHNLPRQDRRDH